MKKFFLNFCLLLAISIATVSFTSCSEEDNSVAVTEVELSDLSITLFIGDETTLKATVTPGDATDKTVTWTSGNPAVASVANGKVTALAEGTTIVTAQAGNQTATCEVTVRKFVAVTGVELSDLSLTLSIGDEITLEATVTPDDATDKTVTWTSSNAAVVSVDNGKLTALTEGTATVTAQAGNQTATCEVTVRDPLFDAGVVINGVKWATRNVDKPGTFAAKPTDAGMLYQYNRKLGWSATNPIVNSNGGTEWDNGTPSTVPWEKTNDPCPAGWQLPYHAKLTLFDTDLVSNEWTSVNGVSGRKFTDKASGNSIFLPAAGTRSSFGVFDAGIYGSYYSGAIDIFYENGTPVYWSGCCYDFDSDLAEVKHLGGVLEIARSIRCVEEWFITPPE
jgi:hypothetical protein